MLHGEQGCHLIINDQRGLLVALRGMKKVHRLSSGNKSQITVLDCPNAVIFILRGEHFNYK